MGKVLSETELAYMAGLIDADGAIMALIERHEEKKFKFRVRVALKFTQKDPYILHWIRSKFLIGKVKRNRTTFDWITRGQSEICVLLKLFYPFLRLRKSRLRLLCRLLIPQLDPDKICLKLPV